MEKIKFVPLTHTSGTTTYVRADTITELTNDGDRTIVYTSYLDKPFKVKERLDKILAEIGEQHDSN